MREKTGMFWVWAVILPLTLYSAIRNLNLILSTLSSDPIAFITGLFALFALDAGVLIWTWALDGAESKVQTIIAVGLVLFDLVGALAGVVADTMLNTNREAFAGTIQTVAIYLIPVVIFCNLAAGFVYKMTDPDRQARIEEKRIEREMKQREKRTELELRQAHLEADLVGKQNQAALLRHHASLALMRNDLHGANGQGGTPAMTTLASPGAEIPKAKRKA